MDLAAHNNPDLSVLQIGHSAALVNRLMSVLGNASGTTMRCSRYTVLDRDLERITLCKNEHHQWSDIVSFGFFDMETLEDDPTWAENPFDIVITNSDLLEAEQVQHLKKCLRPEGMMIIGKPSTEDLGW